MGQMKNECSLLVWRGGEITSLSRYQIPNIVTYIIYLQYVAISFKNKIRKMCMSIDTSQMKMLIEGKL